MSQVGIIIGREFTTRVRTRSFLVLTLVVPILLAGFYAFLMWMLLNQQPKLCNSYIQRMSHSVQRIYLKIQKPIKTLSNC